MSIVTAFPQVPVSRNAMTPQQVAQYITGPAYANDAALASAVTDVQTDIAAGSDVTKASSVPSTGKANDLWIDSSSGNQLKVCIGTYSAGEVSKSSYWSAVADSTAQSAAASALSAAQTVNTSTGTSFPSAYTQGWIFVNSSTGASYICITTYTATTSALDRPSKFLAQVDVATSAIATSVRSAVDDMGDDEKITPSEKLVLQREWQQIQSNKGAMSALADANGLSLNADYTSAITAYNNLDTYLNTTLAVFDDLTATENLVTSGSNRSEWNTKWTTWYSTNATFTKTATAALKTSMDLDQSDETITETEARDYKVDWDYEVQNKINHEATVDALVTAGLVIKASNVTWLTYLSAYNALNTYLNTTLNLFAVTSWPFVLSSVGSNAAEWKSKWNTYSTAERAMSVLGNTTIADTIDSYANDGTVDQQEKRGVKNAWGAIYGDAANGEYALLSSRATALISAGNSSLSALKASMDVAYTNLYNYLFTTLSGYSNIFNMSTNTTVDNTTWDGIWKTYYTAYATLDSAASSIAEVNVGLLDSLVDDGVITAGKEKQTLIEKFADITSEKAKMLTRAAIGVGATTTAYTGAYSALQDYLYALFTDYSGFINTSVGATGISRSTWASKWNAYYEAREDLETAILNNNIANLSRDSAAIPNMVSVGDPEITSDEKYVADQYWHVIFGTGTDDGEHAALHAQASGLGVLSATITAFDNAFTKLWNFLTDDSHGSPTCDSAPTDVFNNMAVSTNLTTPQVTEWQTIWSAYYSQRDAIAAAITSELQADLDDKLSKSLGGSMTANITFDGTHTVGGLPAAVSAGQAVRYDEFNALVSGVPYQRDVVGQIHATTLKATPALADEVVIEDSEASWAKKRVPLTGMQTALLSAHSALTGTSVHGLGTAATANKGYVSGNVIESAGISDVSRNFWAFTEISTGKLQNLNGQANMVLTTDSNGAASYASQATGFNKALGTGSGQVAEGNHTHTPTLPTVGAMASGTGSVSLSLTRSEFGSLISDVWTCGYYDDSGTNLYFSAHAKVEFRSTDGTNFTYFALLTHLFGHESNGGHNGEFKGSVCGTTNGSGTTATVSTDNPDASHTLTLTATLNSSDITFTFTHDQSETWKSTGCFVHQTTRVL